MLVDPLTRLSPHFVLADFLGSHTIFTRGLKNNMEGSEEEVAQRLTNGSALCEHMLEPILDSFGPLSVSYGYISPAVSRATITYQHPEKPSHHRWDLGAAADVCVHHWVDGVNYPIADPALNLEGAPVMLAFQLNAMGLPYSRILTYSESPYLCLAVSAAEVAANAPRKAFYENRYLGVKKPEYRTYSSPSARRKNYMDLMASGLPVPWQGAGYPTYHGGGRCQYQHRRVSRYTMLSDWLCHLQSIANGAKNIPSLTLDSVQDAIGAAGIVYDYILAETQASRFSIISGYVAHTNKNFLDVHEWRNGRIAFKLLSGDAHDYDHIADALGRVSIDFEVDEGIWVYANTNEVYEKRQELNAITV